MTPSINSSRNIHSLPLRVSGYISEQSEVSWLEKLRSQLRKTTDINCELNTNVSKTACGQPSEHTQVPCANIIGAGSGR